MIPDNGFANDERGLCSLAEWLKLDEFGWHKTVLRAQRLVKSQDFQRIAGLVARALELKDELRADDLRWLVPDQLLNKYIHTNRDSP